MKMTYEKPITEVYQYSVIDTLTVSFGPGTGVDPGQTQSVESYFISK